MMRVTQLTRVYKKKAKFKSILTFREYRVQRHMDKVRSVVLEKMDPRYASEGLNSQKSISCET